MKSHRRSFSLGWNTAAKWLILVLSFLAAVAAFYEPPSPVIKPYRLTPWVQAEPSAPADAVRGRLIRSMENFDRQRLTPRTQNANRTSRNAAVVAVTGIRG
jgi:hypothetical protein